MSANFDGNPTVVRNGPPFIISRKRSLRHIWCFFFIWGNTKRVLFFIVANASQKLIFFIHWYKVFYYQVLNFQISVNNLKQVMLNTEQFSHEELKPSGGVTLQFLSFWTNAAFLPYASSIKTTQHHIPDSNIQQHCWQMLKPHVLPFHCENSSTVYRQHFFFQRLSLRM